MRANHERLVRLEVEGAGGRLMSVMGDGTLSVFDGPGRRCEPRSRFVGQRPTMSGDAGGCPRVSCNATG